MLWDEGIYIYICKRNFCVSFDPRFWLLGIHLYAVLCHCLSLFGLLIMIQLRSFIELYRTINFRNPRSSNISRNFRNSRNF